MSEISKAAQSVIDYLGCECVHIPKGAELLEVNETYDELFAKRDGYIPIIFGIEHPMEFDSDQHSADLQKEVFAAPHIDAEKWFGDVIKRYKDDYGDDWNDVVGDMEDGEAMHGFSGIMDFGTGKSMECVIAKIPVKNPWEIFAWFPFGGWNECPMPEEMLWIGKYWYEKFGAIPALMTRDVLEFKASPVMDKKAAMDLAIEHFAFCSDIVFQGVETIGRLADSLTMSTTWYFWWD